MSGTSEERRLTHLRFQPIALPCETVKPGVRPFSGAGSLHHLFCSSEKQGTPALVCWVRHGSAWFGKQTCVVKITATCRGLSQAALAFHSRPWLGHGPAGKALPSPSAGLGAMFMFSKNKGAACSYCEPPWLQPSLDFRFD